MPVGTAYELAAVMLSFIIIIYYNKTRKIAVFQDEILLLLVVMNALTAACDIIRYILLCIIGGENLANGTLMACSTGYFATHIVVIPLMCLYIKSIAKSWKESSLISKLSFILPMLLAVGMIVNNLWTGFLFSYTPEGVYQRGPGIIGFYLIAFYYLIYLLCLIVGYRKYYSFTRKVIFFIIIASCVFATLIQFLFPQQTVETIVIAISALVLLFLIQNPAAQIDRVTGAYSKSAFYTVMKNNCLSRKKRELYLVVLQNLQGDDFNFDYEKLDSALLQVTRFLQELNKRSSVYRIEKYVFCVEIPKISGMHAELILDKIRKRFEKPWGYLECNLFLEAKLGRISIPWEIGTMDQLIGVLDHMILEEDTDKVMHVVDYDLEKIERTKKISDALAQSMENRDFDIRYTPICFLKNKDIVGAEITIRFYDESLGYVYDDEILEFAEKAGHVVNLGQLIFEYTCRIIGEEKLQEMGIDLICIQILPAMCMLPGLSDKLIDTMERYHVAPSSICLQISEDAIARATGVFRENMECLAEKGIKFCLTGYGSGYTNISSIYDLPFSMISFSKSFVQSALVNDKARITLECMLALSKELHMQTRVPGIDDLDYFDMVSEMACDYAEGDYFFEQLDITGFKHLLEDAFAEKGKIAEEESNGV
ncbi:MAG: EAL domain-containing protein [Lachnospiraceae bacterium]